ncbi:MAG: MASE1 domain-containing protein, partial [Verrucomicrobia bacterium]|nr:MASE1 domain-containing protein [Verrucomicrobiota bacterium]
VVSLGSLIQGLVAWYVIHRFSSAILLKSAKDVLVFLLGGGIVTCMIASTIGVTALYYHGVLPGEYVFSTWLTFWLGDTLGVYIITPFLIVWSMAKWKKGGVKLWSLEAAFMAVGFLAITWISLVKTYPLADLFIPLSVWVAYRCGMHGTVLLNIAIALTSTILTSFGYGCLVAYFPDSAMLVLVGFVEIIIGTALIVAAMINERVDVR